MSFYYCVCTTHDQIYVRSVPSIIINLHPYIAYQYILCIDSTLRYIILWCRFQHFNSDFWEDIRLSSSVFNIVVSPACIQRISVISHYILFTLVVLVHAVRGLFLTNHSIWFRGFLTLVFSCNGLIIELYLIYASSSNFRISLINFIWFMLLVLTSASVFIRCA